MFSQFRGLEFTAIRGLEFTAIRGLEFTAIGDLSSPQYFQSFHPLWCSQSPTSTRGPWWRQGRSPSTPEIAFFVFLSLIVRCETKALNGDNPFTFSGQIPPFIFLGCHERVVLGPIAFGRRHIIKKKKKKKREKKIKKSEG